MEKSLNFIKRSSEYDALSQHDSTESIGSDHDENLPSHQKARRSHRWKSYLKLALISGVFLAAYSLLIVSLTYNAAKSHRKIGQRFLKTPVDPEYIVYEPRVMEQWEDRHGEPVTYFGEPSEKIDKGWHDLFKYQNIGVDPKLMKEMDRDWEGIQLPDGTYYGSIMVFHHLHCLKNLYHALNPEYYGLANLTGEEQASWRDHTTHCLHMLKEAVMCQGDTTVLTMMWADYRLRPIGNLTASHECVNWDRLMEWVKPNSRDLTKEGYLVHPKFGTSFVSYGCSSLSTRVADAEFVYDTGPVVVDGHLGNGPVG
ncbi:hypothetical protein ANOM_003131 [Aspergillus nomiae NRRL 13137]|uniref:Tat pathway signal sequence n=1 Tax=Aspergillus nomiae NRRL (strain ATCC 15546 / NRRL 13137 / CBS 260.88 / M93) TaxID=1509407 RepID=A0A0L1JDG0_ASPN3|nr:uncharacterized protein ANOM_003131 [Aspergillus nomiae NRRL 13137]KNG89428.1 hypothetical protein ANOM_003131 [Aspergillus nomiae NRRL 13137]